MPVTESIKKSSQVFVLNYLFAFIIKIFRKFFCLFFWQIFGSIVNNYSGGDRGSAVGEAGAGRDLLEKLSTHRPELLRQDGEH